MEIKQEQQCVKKFIRGATEQSALRKDWLSIERKGEKKLIKMRSIKANWWYRKLKCISACFFWGKQLQKPNQTEGEQKKDGGKNAAPPTKSNQAAAIHNKLHTSSNVIHTDKHTRAHTNKLTWRQFNRCVVLNFNLLLRINLIRCAKLRAALWQHRTWEKKTRIQQEPNARNVVNDLIATTTTVAVQKKTKTCVRVIWDLGAELYELVCCRQLLGPNDCTRTF